MRLFGVEINWSPSSPADDEVWNRSPNQARRLGDLTPEQLRAELAVIKEHVRKEQGVVRCHPEDPWQRIILKQEPPHAACIRENERRKSIDTVYSKVRKTGKIT